jgi:hypothetical protein
MIFSELKVFNTSHFTIKIFGIAQIKRDNAISHRLCQFGSIFNSHF